MTRRIAVVTVGRSDYGIYFPVLRAIQDDPECDLCLIASGAHLAATYGNTISEIEQDGFPVRARVPMLLNNDSPEAVSMSLGIGVINFANAFRELRPDVLLLLGDRFEMLSAAVSALPMRIPLAHLHGGELTYAAIDDSIRHAISKLSHIHFVSTEAYGKRLEQMGEEPCRVHVTGTPVIDAIFSEPPIPKADLENELGTRLDRVLLITYHPVTLQPERTTDQIAALLEALDHFDNELIFTYPNADAGSATIITHLRKFVETRPRAHLYFNLGWRKYHSLQRHVAAMVGNSSSGIVEAASFKLPVVNVGDRQAGRIRTPNIIDVQEHSQAIEDGIRRALHPEFRSGISQMESPYGDGHASRKILTILKTVSLGDDLLVKKFHDLTLQDSLVVRD